MLKLCMVAVIGACVGIGATWPAVQAKDDLGDRQAAFLEGLKAGKSDKAYKDILKGSQLDGQQGTVDTMVDAMEKGYSVYGKMTGFENVGIIRREKNIAYGFAIQCLEKAPLFHQFVWYRNSEEAPWCILSVLFNDKAFDFLDHMKGKK